MLFLPFSSSSFSSRCKPLSHVASSLSRPAPKNNKNRAIITKENKKVVIEKDKESSSPSWFQTTEARAGQHDEVQRQEPSPSP